MSYSPTTWANGDTITAEKLNKMEQGIASGGGAYFVEASLDLGTGRTTCNKTAQEIAEAFAGGSNVILGFADVEYNDYSFRTISAFDFGNYDPQDFYFNMVTINSSGSVVSWTANTASDYPYTESTF